MLASPLNSDVAYCQQQVLDAAQGLDLSDLTDRTEYRDLVASMMTRVSTEAMIQIIVNLGGTAPQNVARPTAVRIMTNMCIRHLQNKAAVQEAAQVAEVQQNVVEEAHLEFLQRWRDALQSQAAGLSFASTEDRVTFRARIATFTKDVNLGDLEELARSLGATPSPNRRLLTRAIADAYMALVPVA